VAACDVAPSLSSASVKIRAARALTITGLVRMSSAIPLCAQRRRSAVDVDVDVDEEDADEEEDGNVVVGAAVATAASSGSSSSSIQMCVGECRWGRLIRDSAEVAAMGNYIYIYISFICLIAFRLPLQFLSRCGFNLLSPKVTFRSWFLYVFLSFSLFFFSRPQRVLSALKTRWRSFQCCKDKGKDKDTHNKGITWRYKKMQEAISKNHLNKLNVMLSETWIYYYFIQKGIYIVSEGARSKMKK